MPSLSQVLSRAGEVTVQTLLGTQTVALLGKIDPNYARPQSLKDLIIDSLGWEGILLDGKIRLQVLELLREEEALELLTWLDIKPVKTAFLELRQASIPAGSLREKKLFSYFSLQSPNREWEFSPPTEETVVPQYQAFPHQVEMIQQLNDIVQDTGNRVIVHMPTGSGKTRTTMNFICEYFRKNPNSTVLWLAYSEELCEQAISEFTRSWKSLGNQPAKIHRHFGYHPAPTTISGNTFLVSGLSKMVNAMKDSNDLFNLLMGKLKLIVMDEAHQAIAPTYKEVLEKLLLRGAHLVGLTATPGRSYEADESNRQLATFFQNRKIELKIAGYDSAVDYLVEKEYLAKTEFVEIEGAKEGILSEDEIRSVQTSMDIPNDILKKLAYDEFRNLSIVRKIRELTELHKRIIYFAPSLDNAEHIAFVLKMLKVNAYLVSSKKERRSRTEVVRKFLSDEEESMVICNFGILTTGFDAPKTSCVVIGRPTRSLVLYSQMAGRAIRGPKAGGNAHAQVYTVTDTSLKGFGTIQDAFIHWNDYYKTREDFK